MTLIVIFLIIILLVLTFLFYAAELLVKEDDISHVENAVIILLMGSLADRSLGVADLYKKGKSNKIIMAESSGMGTDLLIQRNIYIDGIAKRSKKILSGLGVDEKDIIILPGDTKSTVGEALAIRQFILNTNEIISEIIIVTSKYHSFRSKLIFKLVLDKLNIDIYSVPTTYDSFKSRGWYLDKVNAKNVVYEYIKLFYYLFFERFQIKNNNKGI